MIITQTPFRMSFFGGGTDMESFFKEYGGSVLSATFDKYCYVNSKFILQKISNNPSLNSVHQYTHQSIIQPLITPTLRSASGQGERPRVPDAPKIEHDKMKQFYMIDMERKRW